MATVCSVITRINLSKGIFLLVMINKLHVFMAPSLIIKLVKL